MMKNFLGDPISNSIQKKLGKAVKECKEEYYEECTVEPKEAAVHNCNNCTTIVNVPIYIPIFIPVYIIQKISSLVEFETV